MKAILILFILIFVLGILVGKFLLNRIFIKNKKINEIKKNILEKKEPYTPEEVKLYTQAIEKFRNQRPVYAWGTYLLFKFYMNKCYEDKEVLSKCLELAEKIRADSLILIKTVRTSPDDRLLRIQPVAEEISVS